MHGIYLEDLYVRPAARRTGAGRLLMATLAALCVERGYQRLEWHMLDWNPAAEFYRAVGAEPIPQWVPRVVLPLGFALDDEQKNVAEAYIAQLNAAKVFKAKIATTIE